MCPSTAEPGGLSAAQAEASGGPLEIVSSRMGYLWDALVAAYEALRFDVATGGDEVFRGLVLARESLLVDHTCFTPRSLRSTAVYTRISKDHAGQGFGVANRNDND